MVPAFWMAVHVHAWAVAARRRALLEGVVRGLAVAQAGTADGDGATCAIPLLRVHACVVLSAALAPLDIRVRV